MYKGQDTVVSYYEGQTAQQWKVNQEISNQMKIFKRNYCQIPVCSITIDDYQLQKMVRIMNQNNPHASIKYVIQNVPNVQSEHLCQSSGKQQNKVKEQLEQKDIKNFQKGLKVHYQQSNDFEDSYYRIDQYAQPLSPQNNLCPNKFSFNNLCESNQNYEKQYTQNRQIEHQDKYLQSLQLQKIRQAEQIIQRRRKRGKKESNQVQRCIEEIEDYMGQSNLCRTQLHIIFNENNKIYKHRKTIFTTQTQTLTSRINHFLSQIDL